MANYSHIELFAGCGGMSLGLGATGFDLVMANEVSPMAGETFAFNLLGEDLQRIGLNGSHSEKVLWLKSQYARHQVTKRLRENPFQPTGKSHSDISSLTQLPGKLVIGEIDELLQLLKRKPNLLKQLRRAKVDLISGGPPCQGFSLAGKRVHGDHKNLLPLSFARFVGLLKPKIAVLENVRGIVAPFTVDGVKHHSWVEVSKAFALQGYAPVCMLVNAAQFKVPQFRVRFVMLAIRHDVARVLQKRWAHEAPHDAQVLSTALRFYSQVQKNKNNLGSIGHRDLALYDSEGHADLFKGRLLPKLSARDQNFVTTKDAVDDIRSTSARYVIDDLESGYARQLGKLLPKQHSVAHEELMNHEPRIHSFPVMARFRLYQVINSFNGNRHHAMRVVNGQPVPATIKADVLASLMQCTLLSDAVDGPRLRKPNTPRDLAEYLDTVRSQKHSQRAIHPNEPAPSQLTIPDDLCHYSSHQLRTLTVREMARLQSFPDWFSFRSKATTGGTQRSFEVPQYTQVGNAVPPLLAYALGLSIRTILDEHASA